MRSRWAALLVGAWVVAVCGCRSIDNVRVKQGPAQPLTTEEARKLYDEGVALYHQQPRGLASVKDAANRLERAAGALTDDYAAQWQAAQAFEFLAENETRTDSRRVAAQRGSCWRVGRAS